jgi:DNA mismatch endonuclease (patch repair protein)
MVDTLTREARSQRMARIRGKDTVPEWVVRRLAHSMGFRFRLHRRDLPGKPDLVFPSQRRAIFVHGCYWHGHDCKIGRLPKSNVAFWEDKILRNRARDARNLADLKTAGWDVLVVWQCETKSLVDLEASLRKFLGS